ncbi:synaptonemal complex protein 1 [Apis mellifera carnica]|nr:synaptonemal complex protein 1 [Apis mellifera carnica]
MITKLPPFRIKDVRWMTKDKLDQYRGVLKLYARQKKIRFQDALKLKKKVLWQLNSYNRDIKNYHEIIREITKGTPKGEVYRLLQTRKNLRLKYRGRETEHVYDSIYEENHQKRRQLDILRFEKKKKMKECFNLQIEHAEVIHIYELEERTKQNAARAISLTYNFILKILKKDAMYYENLLNNLQLDRRSQCKVILRTTIMGQIAAEETNDIEMKYKHITRDVWNNMKERERMLAHLHEQVEDLWSFAQSLIRTESETIMKETVIKSNEILDKQIKSLEDVFNKIKDSLLVHTYREMFSRLEDQMKQRTRLLEQFDRNVKERDALLLKKKEALSALSNFEYTRVAGVEEYNADKNILLEQIAMQKKRELEKKNVKKEHGELLMDIRAALQNMVAMLVCVKRGNRVPTKKPTEELDKKIDIPMMEKMETDSLALLSNVSRKVGQLFGMSNFEFDKDREERARDLYQTYVSNYRSNVKFKEEEVEPPGLIVEHQAIDTLVPTRAEIKLRSKQAVEAYLRLE